MKYFPPMILSCLILIVFLVIAFRIIKKRIKDTAVEFWSFGGESASRSIANAYGLASKGLGTLAGAYGLTENMATSYGLSRAALKAREGKEKLSELAENAKHQSYRRGERANLLAERRSIAEDKLNPYNDSVELNKREKDIIDNIKKQEKVFNDELKGVKEYGSIRKYLNEESPDSIETILGSGKGKFDLVGGEIAEKINKEDSVAYSDAMGHANNALISTSTKAIIDYTQEAAVEVATSLSTSDIEGLNRLTSIGSIKSGRVAGQNAANIMDIFGKNELEGNGINFNSSSGSYDIVDINKAKGLLDKSGIKLNYGDFNFKYHNSDGSDMAYADVKEKLTDISTTSLASNGIERNKNGEISIFSAELASKFLGDRGIYLGMSSEDYALEIGNNTSSILLRSATSELGENARQLFDFNTFMKEKGYEVINKGSNKFQYKMDMSTFKQLSDAFFYSKAGNETVLKDTLPLMTGRNFEGNFAVRKGFTADVKDSELENFVNFTSSDSRFVEGVNYKMDIDSGKVAFFDKGIEEIAMASGYLENGSQNNIIVSDDVKNGESYLKAATIALTGASRHGNFVIADSNNNILEARKSINNAEDRLNPIEVVENLKFDIRDKNEVIRIARANGVAGAIKDTGEELLIKMEDTDSFLGFFEGISNRGIDSSTEVSIRCNNEDKLNKIKVINKDLFGGSTKVGNNEILLAKEAGIAAGDLDGLENILNKSVSTSTEQVKIIDKGRIFCQDVDSVLKIISNDSLGNPYINGVHYDVVGSEVIFRDNSELFNNKDSLNKLVDKINLGNSSLIVDKEGLGQINMYLSENEKRGLVVDTDYVIENGICHLTSSYAKNSAYGINGLSHTAFLNEIETKAIDYRDSLLTEINDVSYKDVYGKNVGSEEGNIITLNFGNKLNNQAFMSLLNSNNADENLLAALEVAGINVETGEGIIRSGNTVKIITKDDMSSKIVKDRLEDALDDAPKIYMIIVGRKKEFYIEKRFKGDKVLTKTVAEIPDKAKSSASIYRLSYYEDSGKFFMEDILNGGFQEVNESEIDKDKAINVIYNVNIIDSKKLLREKLDRKRKEEKEIIEKSRGIDDYKKSLRANLNMEESDGQDCLKYDLNNEGVPDNRKDKENEVGESFPSAGKLVGAVVKETSNEISALLDFESRFSQENLSDDKKLVVTLTEAGIKFSLANKAVNALGRANGVTKSSIYTLLVKFLGIDDNSENSKNDKTEIIAKLESLLK